VASIEPVAADRREPGLRSAAPPAIRVEGLSKIYRIGEMHERHRTLRDALMAMAKAPARRLRRLRRSQAYGESIWALRDVSFEVPAGDVVGVIGRNGAGKSTLLKILSRITQPTEGMAEIRGRVGSLLEVGTGFHSELTGRENIYLNGAILGMRRAEITQKFDEIVAFAEIAKFIDTPVKHYSSGMYLRLAFAVAAHLEPEILLVDEVLAVGDVMFQKKCLGKMEDVARTGRTVMFVSHNMGAMRSLCRSGLLLDEGRLVESGDIGRCIESYFTRVGAFASDESSGKRSPGTSGFGRVLLHSERKGPVEQSEWFEAETSLHIPQEVSGFSLFCIVEDMQGRMLFHLREESPVFGLPQVTSGDYAIRVRIPPLWLSAGLYTLYFKVLFWGEAKDARHLSDKVPIAMSGLHSNVNAPLNPAVKWKVAKA
jgi:lipopolysaccharide transport system ATP-binding protein